jgi:hypothetical protein
MAEANTQVKKSETISVEEKVARMQAGLKAKMADPKWQEQQKIKREERKARKLKEKEEKDKSSAETATASSAEKKPRKKLTPEQQAAANAKRKATLESKKSSAETK